MRRRPAELAGLVHLGPLARNASRPLTRPDSTRLRPVPPGLFIRLAAAVAPNSRQAPRAAASTSTMIEKGSWGASTSVRWRSLRRRESRRSYNYCRGPTALPWTARTAGLPPRRGTGSRSGRKNMRKVACAVRSRSVPYRHARVNRPSGWPQLWRRAPNRPRVQRHLPRRWSTAAPEGASTSARSRWSRPHGSHRSCRCCRGHTRRTAGRWSPQARESRSGRSTLAKVGVAAIMDECSSAPLLLLQEACRPHHAQLPASPTRRHSIPADG